MLQLLIVIVICIIAYKVIVYYQNKKKQERINPDFIIKNITNSSYIAFKGDDFYISGNDTAIPVKNTLYMITNNGINLPKYNVSISANNDEQQRFKKRMNDLGGIPCFAEVSLPVTKNIADNLGLLNTSTKLCSLNTKTKESVFVNDPKLLKYQLVDLSFTPKYKTESTTTTKGRGGKALLGGVIAGPIGAVVGASGKRKSQTTSTTTEVDAPCALSLIRLNDNVSFEITVNAKSDTVQFIRENYLNRKIAIENQKNTEINDLRKLKQLVDEGIITQEEFEMKKKQILGL